MTYWVGTTTLSDVLHQLGSKINQTNKNNGFDPVTPEDWSKNRYKVPACIALITSELSEALEAFRKDDLANFGEELADVFIRLLDTAEGLEIDLGSAIEAKMLKNQNRPYRHGGKRV